MTHTQRSALIGVLAAVVTLILKFAAYYMTKSVSLFSDALESFVNLAAAGLAFLVLTLASKPADDKHPYGHDKAEYFSSGVEGSLILFAAVSIIYAAFERLMNPIQLTHIGIGITVSILASAVNFMGAKLMLKASHTHDSITLEASSKHLMTDVLTSIGIVLGLLVIIFFPHLQILDAIMAIVVGIMIITTGIDLVKRSLDGLMDSSLPYAEVKLIQELIQNELPKNASFTELKTRKSGSRRFVEFKLLVPGTMPVIEAHDHCDALEITIGKNLKKCTISIHVEPIEVEGA